MIKINIDDVVSAGSVEGAIHEFCRNSDEIASGIIGPSFDCSGPGSGWQKKYDETDYAARALSPDYGAVAYVDVCGEWQKAIIAQALDRKAKQA